MCRVSMHTSSHNRGAFDCSVAELPWVIVVLFVSSNFPSCALVLVFSCLGWKIKQVVRCLSFSHCTSVEAREPGMHRQPSCYMTIQRLLAYSILKYENDLTQMTMRNIKHLASFPQPRLSLLISVFVTDLDRADLITTCLIIIVRHCCPNCDCADKIFYTDWYLSTD